MIVEHAPAKLNLYLHVLGRRADGYHLLDSLVAFAEAGDVIAVEPAAALDLAIDGPFAAALAGEADNLVLRAARALASASGTDAGAAIRLTKNLPLAAGLGGGSADAAAALRALCRLWRLGPHAPLDAIAQRLGADVPVCLDGRASYVGGIGERRDPVPGLPPAALVLVNPRVPLPTPHVFARCTGAFASGPWRLPSPPADAAALAAMLAETRNGLTDAAAAIVPAVRDVLEALGDGSACLLARMSGSGATCFGLYPDGAAAQAAARHLARAQPGWWVMPTRLLGASGAE